MRNFLLVVLLISICPNQALAQKGKMDTLIFKYEPPDTVR